MTDNNNWNHEDNVPQADHWVEYDLSDQAIGDVDEIRTDAAPAAQPHNTPAETPKPVKNENPATEREPADHVRSTKPTTGNKRTGKRDVMVSSSQLDADADAEDAPEARDYRPVRFRRDGKLGCLGGLMYAVFIISVSIILACLGWMAASDLLALNKEPLVATVELPRSIFTDKEIVVEEDGEEVTKTLPSADMAFVADALKDSGIIEYPFLFKLYAKFSKADIKIDPGTYELSTNFDYRALVKKMQAGSESQIQTLITFPEGYNMRQIFEKLEEENICSQESLYEAAANAKFSFSFLDSVTAQGSERLEGYLFPDTYYFYEGMSATSAINKFLTNMHYLITADMLATADNQGLTWNEVIIIASLIEKETSGSTEDRANISCVIHNRLEADMPLQIDASVLYDHPDYSGAPTSEMLAEDSPHNTHTRTGLPQTAIANPGLASIQAALKPTDAKYYYYALDEETGEHRFFTNYNDHAAFVATQSYGK